MKLKLTALALLAIIAAGVWSLVVLSAEDLRMRYQDRAAQTLHEARIDAYNVCRLTEPKERCDLP